MRVRVLLLPFGKASRVVIGSLRCWASARTRSASLRRSRSRRRSSQERTGCPAEWDDVDASAFYEVADWIDGVRILDPDGEDVSVEQGLAYLAARIRGDEPGQALLRVRTV